MAQKKNKRSLSANKQSLSANKQSLSKNKRSLSANKQSLSKNKLPVLDLEGKKISEITLGINIAKPNLPLLAQAVRVYLTNQRRAFAKTKTRGEVSGSGRKIWRQKGTGRARHGDRYAPIFVGGGKAHGPKGNQAYDLKMPRKMRRLALLNALSEKINNQRVIVLSGLDKVEPKTKKGKEILDKLLVDKLNNKRSLSTNKESLSTNKEKILVIMPERWQKTVRAFKNIPFVDLALADNLNTYQVLNHHWLLFALEAAEKINQGVKKNG